jgi:hypothetical protein
VPCLPVLGLLIPKVICALPPSFRIYPTIYGSRKRGCCRFLIPYVPCLPVLGLLIPKVICSLPPSFGIDPMIYDLGSVDVIDS